LISLYSFFRRMKKLFIKTATALMLLLVLLVILISLAVLYRPAPPKPRLEPVWITDFRLMSCPASYQP
jgi:hypothetical protein